MISEHQDESRVCSMRQQTASRCAASGKNRISIERDFKGESQSENVTTTHSEIPLISLISETTTSIRQIFWCVNLNSYKERL